MGLTYRNATVANPADSEKRAFMLANKEKAERESGVATLEYQGMRGELACYLW